MRLRTIHDLGDLRGKRVLTRVDFNVPMEGQRILDDTRIRMAIPTITELQRSDAMVILLAHLRDGKPRQTLAPIAERLRSFLPSARVRFVRDRVGSATLARSLARMRSGDVVLLENVRRYPGEATNDPAFARALAALGDCFVNEAFGVAHRTHASVVGIPEHLPSAAGKLFARETQALTRLVDHPTPPFVALIGGAKITTKVPVLKRLVGIADAVLLGGALANSFFAARGYGVGASLVEDAGIVEAKRLLRNKHRRNLMLPIDVVVGNPKARKPHPTVVPIGAKPHDICSAPNAILDIGPKTIRAYAQQIKSAATIVWNGPMGWFERPPYHHGSVILGRVVASRASGRAFGVVGGGETLAVLAATHMAQYVDHVSSGGGAMLSFLAGERMPAIEMLQTYRKLNLLRIRSITRV